MLTNLPLAPQRGGRPAKSPVDQNLLATVTPTDVRAPEWEANHVQTIPGRGWFRYFRAYGASGAFIDGSYTYPTVNRVVDFDDLT